MTNCMSCNPGNTPNLQGASLVGVGVVVVVLDPPRLEGVDERRERQRPHDVLQQLVLAEAAVPGVVAHHEPLHGAREQSLGDVRALSDRFWTSLGLTLQTCDPAADNWPCTGSE